MKTLRCLALSIVTLGLTFAIYQSSWESPFVLDDWTKIENNPDLRLPFQIENFVYPYAATELHFRNDPSRPLTYMVYWLCWHAGDGDPWYFHVVNTAAHALCALLLLGTVALLWRRLFGRTSVEAGAVVAMLYLTSPLIANTVLYCFGLSDILCATFTLAALLPLLHERPRLWRQLLSIGFFTLALTAKQSAIVFPALLVAIDLLTRRWRPRLYVAPTLLALFYLCLRFLYFGGVGDLEAHNQLLPAGPYLLLQGLMILKYAQMTLIPTGFSVDHYLLPTDFSLGECLTGWIAVIAISFAAWRSLQSKAWLRLVGLGWVIFLIALLPTSSFMPTVDFFVERRAYVADLGWFMAVGGLLALAQERSRLWSVVILLLIGGQSFLAIERARVFASPEKLWREALTSSPMNPRARLNLAVFYSAEKRWEESRQLFEQMLRDQPKNSALYSKLAYIYSQKTYVGYDEHLAWLNFQKALELDPQNISALYNAGALKLEQKNYAEAEQLFRRATELNPHMTAALQALVHTLVLQGRTQEAVQVQQKIRNL